MSHCIWGRDLGSDAEGHEGKRLLVEARTRNQSPVYQQLLRIYIRSKQLSTTFSSNMKRHL